MGWTNCTECGWAFDYDRRSDKYCHDEETGEYLCENCTKLYNDLAMRMMEKHFKSMPTLYRQALAIDRLTGLGDLCDVVTDEREE